MLMVTSSNAMIKRLGVDNWLRLHRLSYVLAIGAVFHYFWLVKKDLTLPAYYALILACLFLVRLIGRPRKALVTVRVDKLKGPGGMNPSVPR